MTKNLISTVIDETRKLSTYHLLNLIYIVFSFPLLLGLIFFTVFVTPRGIEVDTKILKFFVFFSFSFFGFGGGIGGIVIFMRREVPAYMPFAGLSGKPAKVYGIIQTILFFLAAVVSVISPFFL
ncbi:MAG: hypothetical protein KJZ77_11230 [Anaerolineales bacterium]|nr:hypothetical protein [Anaerolineales bacterium]